MCFMIEQTNMEELEKYVLDNYINKLAKMKDGKKVIIKSHLSNLKLNSNEMAFVRQLLDKYDISLIDEEIKKSDRSSLVRDFEYGEVSGLEIKKNDKPLLANLEYDEDDNLVYEYWDELEYFLENEFIPKNVQIKKKWDKDINDYIFYQSIQLNKIVKLKLSEQEVEYVMEYLEDKGIRVAGKSSSLVGEFDNYDYVNTYYGNDLPDVLPTEVTRAKLLRYNEKKTKELRDEIITDNIRLARFEAYEVSKYTKIPARELETFAYEGLIKAVESFAPEKDYSFSTHACLIMRNTILRNIGSLYGYSSLTFYKDFSHAKSIVEKELCLNLEDNPEIVDDILDLLVVSGKLSESRKDDMKVEVLLHNPDSIDKYIDDNEYSNLTKDEYLCDDFDCDIFSEDNLLHLELVKKLANEEITELLEYLSVKQRFIIEKRFGLVDGEEKTFVEIGKLLGLSRTRIDQIEDKVLRRLKRISYHYGQGKIILKEFDQYSYNPNTIVAYQKGKYKG